MPKALSFDLDGTLTSHAFADGVWDEGLPRAVALRHGLTVPAARDLCRAAYAREGDHSIRWYQLPYWLEAFGLPGADAQALVDAYTPRIALCPDVTPTLIRLRERGFSMVIFSNATRVFLDAQVRSAGLAPYFDAVISVPDDWGTVKAEQGAYARLETLIGAFVHVGDHLQHDCEVPRSIGIEAYHVWRGSGERRADSLDDLHAFARVVAEKP